MNINDKLEGRYYSPEQLLIHNALLMGFHYNRKWLTWMFTKRRLGVKEGSYSIIGLQNTLQSLFKLMDIFEAKYGDKCEFSLWYDSSEGNYVPIFKVIYDEFIIENGTGRKHKIQGLFIIHHFEYREGHLRPRRMYGGRIKKTTLELASGYQQSHLGTLGKDSFLRTPFYSGTFCVGSDTDVSRMLAEFKIDMDYDRYELFLYTVDSMVQWESLEGVPYIKMETIENALSGKVTTSSYVNELAVLKYILKEKIPLDFDYYISEGVYRIKPNRKASDLIKKVVLTLFKYPTYKKILVTTIDNKNFVEMRAEGETLKQGTSFISKGKQAHYTIFRGQKLYPKIININSRHQKKVSLEDYIIYPKFLENVLRKFEIRIFEKTVAKNAAKLISSTNNATECPASGTIPV